MPKFPSAASRAGRPASDCRFSLVGKMGCPAEKLKGQNEAEAEVEGPDARADVEPVRHPADPGIEPEAAPAKHAKTSGNRADRVRLRLVFLLRLRRQAEFPTCLGV